MIHPKRLLDDLKRLLRRLEADLRERAGTVAELAELLQREYRVAREAGRTGESFEMWRDGTLTQAAAAWLLGCVFVRFLEDNGLVEEALLSGPLERRRLAAERQMQYFQRRPTDSDRDYLYDVFRTVQQLPAVTTLFDAQHNPVWAYGISGDAAKWLIAFWRQVVPETGELVHDFTDATWNTRFLGDLYQELSEDARKRFALLQTPEFVEEFILDRTLEPAIAVFGLKDVRLIDPTCGSGHFLLGAFQRLLDKWLHIEPGTAERELVQRALDAVYGVDVNPYAVAIARFRLLVAALQASKLTTLRHAPGFRLNVAVGDSLLHGRRFEELDLKGEPRHPGRAEGLRHAYGVEDLEALNRILGQQYHVVVGNPPYITVKDQGLSQKYRQRYSTCHQKYSLGIPFTERFFDLVVYGHNSQPGGYVGIITTNSFMKREGGKKLIEEFFPRIDLTHVIDTSGAYIPGHGTPTVILFGRHRAPVSPDVRAVLGIQGEPGTPEEPAQGKVWRSIVEHLDNGGAQNKFVSVTNVPRETFARHPWSIGGGGAAELKEMLESTAAAILELVVDSIGITSFTLEDEAYILPTDTARRRGIDQQNLRPMVVGDSIRDWVQYLSDPAIFPYDKIFVPLAEDRAQQVFRHLSLYRACLANNKMFGGKTKVEAGLKWYEYGRLTHSKLRTPLSIVLAFVATHNHFVFDRGGKVFNRSAPIIKLPSNAPEEDHLALLGLLNSSTACFWMKQVFHNKGSTVDEKGARQTTVAFENFYEFTGTGLQKFPITAEKPLDLATTLDYLAQEWQTHLPGQLAAHFPLARAALDAHKEQATALLRRMIALQEELDWRCYTLYGIADQDLCYRDASGNQLDPPAIALGQRAFEIVMARKMAAGELETTWFERHRSTPITELLGHWPDDYRLLVERRMALIESNQYINLIERPEYKRRWNTEPWEEQEKRALKSWLLDRLEDERYWPEPQLQTTRTLADMAQFDDEWMQVAELYRGYAGFDVPALVAELVEAEAVPFLPVLRYKATGLRKREVWERTWELQRREDAIDADVAATLTRQLDESAEQFQARLAAAQRHRKQEELGDIPPPPKYTSADFLNATCWRLRGPLDVPKERFISYPGCSRAHDPALAVAWAGWDHLQQARALAAWYTELVEQEGWVVERLTPLLAGIAELIPWLKQWHNDIDPDYHERMGDFFEIFLHGQLQQCGLTREDLKRWTPPARSRPRGRT
jgi:Domain of unknown function (DUF7008)/Eco57I restriction-modification methylase